MTTQRKYQVTVAYWLALCMTLAGTAVALIVTGHYALAPVATCPLAPLSVITGMRLTRLKREERGGWQ